jgi:hypothetical protein
MAASYRGLLKKALLKKGSIFFFFFLFYFIYFFIRYAPAAPLGKFFLAPEGLPCVALPVG